MRPFRFVEVQRKILEQHRSIRARIEALEQVAGHLDLPFAQESLHVLLLRFAVQFDTHLAFEERELAPRIRELDAWGIDREAALRAEHREQRKRIEQVCALSAEPVGADIWCLYEALKTLTQSLLEDMVAEERMIEEIAQIDEYGHDQMTG